MRVNWYTTTIVSDGSGDGVNTDTGVPQWSATFSGIMFAVRLEYTGAAAGTDVTLAEPTGTQRTLLTVTDSNTATTYTQNDLDLTAVSEFDYVVNSRNLTATIAQAGDTNTVKVIVGVAE